MLVRYWVYVGHSLLLIIRHIWEFDLGLSTTRLGNDETFNLFFLYNIRNCIYYWSDHLAFIFLYFLCFADYGITGGLVQYSNQSTQFGFDRGAHKHGCKFCHKVMSSAAALKIHERIHTGERPFQCTKCPKKFAHKGNLKTHYLIHLQDGTL